LLNITENIGPSFVTVKALDCYFNDLRSVFAQKAYIYL
jgi:hypothetical protein